MISNDSNNRFYPIYYFLRAYPKRSIFTVFALLFSGLAEVVSFAAMIPHFLAWQCSKILAIGI